MRCLVVADLHYSLPQFDWLLAAAPEFDVVIFAGDALDIGSFVDFRAQILVVKKYLSLLSGMTRVIFCSGNHDLDERSAEGEKIARWVGDIRELGIACDGDDLTIGDVRFTVCPWWDGPLVKGRIEAQLRDAAAERAQRWIWVHHAPPANSPTSWGGKRFFGDVELVQWIAQYQPSMVISGHVHQSPFIPDGSWFDRLGDTWVFNTGLQHGRPPVYLVVDLDEDTAFWLAAGEAQRVDLRGPLRRPAAEIERHLRAMWPWPRAWTTVHGSPIQIHGASVVDVEHDVHEPGAVVSERRRLIVACGVDALQIEIVEPAGRRTMPATAYLNGLRTPIVRFGEAGAPETLPPLNVPIET